MNVAYEPSILNTKLTKHPKCNNYAKGNIEMMKEITQRVQTTMNNCHHFNQLTQLELDNNPYTNLSEIVQQIYQQKKY